LSRIRQHLQAKDTDDTITVSDAGRMKIRPAPVRKNVLESFLMAEPPTTASLPRTFSRVLFFPCGGLDNACARTRCYAFLPFLSGLGVCGHIASYTWHKYDRNPGSSRRSILSRIWLELLPVRTFFYFFCAHTLFLQKREFHRGYVRAAKVFGKRVVYDIDDAIYLATPEDLHADEPHRMVANEPVRRDIEWILKRCDLALVSGDELARFCRQYAKQVQILPSVISTTPPFTGGHPDSTLFTGGQGGIGKKPVIGWVGAPENQRYLREIEQVLARLQSEIPDLEVWIVTSRISELAPRFRHRFIPWSRSVEEEVIPQFTVGIAPLADDEWCRAKMNYKALVYMGHGVPAVVTPVGFPVDDFTDGQSVLFARTPDDWYLHLESVLTNPALRSELATAGLSVVRRRFSAVSRAPEFIAALKG
jgi:glycosyltransferase involved in cell wall biosynthesis